MTHRPEFRARVLAMYADGKSYKEIEEATGCCAGTISSFASDERKRNPSFLFGRQRKQKQESSHDR